MIKKSLVIFLNLILVFTLVFAWTNVGTHGVSPFVAGETHTSSGLITGVRGQLHPISSTPVGEKGTELTGVMISCERSAVISICVLIIAAIFGNPFLYLVFTAVRTRYNNHVRRRDYRIEYIHHMDGEKSLAPLYQSVISIQRRIKNEPNSGKNLYRSFGSNSSSSYGLCDISGK